MDYLEALRTIRDLNDKRIYHDGETSEEDDILYQECVWIVEEHRRREEELEEGDWN